MTDATQKPVVACFEAFHPAVCEQIEAVAGQDFTMRFTDSYAPERLHRLAEGATFILAGSAPVDAHTIGLATDLKLIQKWGIGVDKIDLEAARRGGVQVAITAGVNAGPVAELAILLMLSVYRPLPEMDRNLRQGNWMKSEARSSCFQIAGKSVGLVGFGSIARMVATGCAASTPRSSIMISSGPIP